jgi:hypothetical protein
MKNNVSLNIMKGNDGILVESLIDSYIAEKFKFGLSNLEVSNVKGFIEALEKFPTLEFSKFVLTKKGNTFYYITKKEDADSVSEDIKDLFIYINVWKQDKAYIELYGKTPKEVETLYNTLSDFFFEAEGFKVQLHHYFIENGLKFDANTISDKDLQDISSDFYPDFISTDMFFEEFLKAKENIVVLSGESGVGKSKFSTLALKYAIEHGEELVDSAEEYFEEEENINVAYVKNEKILALDTFWVNLKKYEYKFVILDDLDFFLSPREQTVTSEIEELKNQFVSHFLSFSDGLVPNKTKFIITTNRGIDSIDEALLRDGRMFGVFSFSRLKKEEAKAIWFKEGLKEEDFENEFGEQEEILQSKLGSVIHSYKANNKEKRRPFLKADSKAEISSKFRRTKKVGF